ALHEAGADGAALDPIEIEQLTLEGTDGARLELAGGAAILSAPPDVHAIAFRGRSVAVAVDRAPAELTLEVTGVLEAR
ncbi:MAG: hypothetical protein KC619_09375, partial [Myxococcales bacterium]|nr:hypothetical protein [Myxococcales bacterium]